MWRTFLRAPLSELPPIRGSPQVATEPCGFNNHSPLGILAKNLVHCSRTQDNPITKADAERVRAAITISSTRIQRVQLSCTQPLKECIYRWEWTGNQEHQPAGDNNFQ